MLWSRGGSIPDAYTFPRSDLRWRRLAKPEQTCNTDSGHLISDALIARLASAALTLEDEFGGPQDIEWTVDHAGQLYLVQTRPITVQTAVAKRCRLEQKTRSLDAAYTQPNLKESGDRTVSAKVTTNAPVVWSNANINENFPEPVSPCFIRLHLSATATTSVTSLELSGSRRSESAPSNTHLGKIIGVHGARMYYNLTHIQTVLRMAPFGDLSTETFNSFVGATQIPQ